jgi:hypothetical protein
VRAGCNSQRAYAVDLAAALALLVMLAVVQVTLGQYYDTDVTGFRWALAQQGVTTIFFFLAQWTEYHTHVLPTAMGPIGVTEAQYTVMGLCIFGGELCNA